MVAVNDICKTKEELLAHFNTFKSTHSQKFVLKETDTTITLRCAAQIFYCDAQISATHKKRDNSYQIKKVKTVHKCPLQFHFNDNFLREEIGKIGGSVGNVTKVMCENGMRIGYASVFRAMNESKSGDENGFVKKGRKRDDDEIENKKQYENSKRDNYKPDYKSGDYKSGDYKSGDYKLSDHKLGDNKRNKKTVDSSFSNLPILISLRDEFLTLNPNSVCEVGETNNSAWIYFSMAYAIQLRNVFELKEYKRKKGSVVYSLGYDNTDRLVVVSCLVTETENGLELFFKHEKSKKNVYLVDWDEEVVDVLEKCKVDYFVKTRSLCKKINGKCEFNDESRKRVKSDDNSVKRDTIKNTSLSFEEIFKRINYDENGIDLNLGVDKSRYCVMNKALFGLNNYFEADLDCVYFSVYNLELVDCFNCILKLVGDNLKVKREKMDLLYKVSRNIRNADDGGRKVDLENLWCECGKYQRYGIPCVHACWNIIKSGENPMDYVVEFYKRDCVFCIVPVVDVPVKCQNDRFLLRRGPGRPKKGRERRDDEEDE